MLNLTIDGRQVSVREGATVIQAAEKAGIFVPRYCYHPGLSIAGNCRICLVEVEKSPKLQIACNLPAGEGMVVHTKSPKAESGRRAVLEFLLANHPLDCPVCDQSGECDLQNFYLDFGLYDPKFREQKVKKRKAVPIGPHVMLDQERCILCSRCVRFTDEITKTGELGIFNRGDHAEVGICDGRELDNRYSANVVDICPVGALTERDFRFKARVWYLSSAPTVCAGCSQGCNIDLHFVPDRPHLNDGDRIVRVKPRYNADVNQWWICDEGRYGFKWVDRGRLKNVRGPSATWDHAIGAIATALAGSRIGVIASARLTNEELFLIREIFGDRLGAQVTTSVPQPPGDSDDLLLKADKNPNTEGAALLGLNAIPAERIISSDLDVLWVMGHDLVALFGEEMIRRASEKVSLFIFSGTNENATVPFANWVLPTAAYVEKDGTFVNCHGRIQRIGRAFPPLGDSREDWRILLDLTANIPGGAGFQPASNPDQIFRKLAQSVPAFCGITYEIIGAQGTAVAPVRTQEGVAAP